MSNLNLLIVEGNIKKDTETFIKAAGTSVSENFRKLIKVFEPECKIDIIEPGNDLEVQKTISKIKDYDGVIFAGGAMRINDQTEEIKKHISLAKECFKSGKKILAVCWGLQVCTVAAGGKVNTGKNGSHVGIATDVKINENGKKHKIYISKKMFLLLQLLILMR
jgi:GMP synthase (glutamine-hydrolysing)